MKDNGSGLDATFLPHNPKILPAIQKHTYWIQKPYIQNSKYCTVGEITVQASNSIEIDWAEETMFRLSHYTLYNTSTACLCHRVQYEP